MLLTSKKAHFLHLATNEYKSKISLIFFPKTPKGFQIMTFQSVLSPNASQPTMLHPLGSQTSFFQTCCPFGLDNLLPQANPSRIFLACKT
jgi:hypothetical protein